MKRFVHMLVVPIIARSRYAIRRLESGHFVHVPSMSLKQMKRLSYFSRMLALARNVDGTVVECGVGTGDSLLMLLFLSHQEGRGRHVWGFDSFRGFPEPGAEDLGRRKPKKGELATDRLSIENMLKVGGFDPLFLESNLTLVEGFFEQTLREYPGPPIALLHIDADLYSSTRTVLQSLFPRVAPGGVVLFDEYINSEPDWPGARLAVDEFFGNLADSIQHDKTVNRYYLVKPAIASG